MAECSIAVFDLGGVLIDWNPRYLYRKLFDGETEAMEVFLGTVCTQSWNDAPALRTELIGLGLLHYRASPSGTGQLRHISVMRLLGTYQRIATPAFDSNLNLGFLISSQ